MFLIWFVVCFDLTCLIDIDFSFCLVIVCLAHRVGTRGGVLSGALVDVVV